MNNAAYISTENEKIGKLDSAETKNYGSSNKKCSQEEEKKEAVTLQRDIGFLSCVGLAVGVTIGSGIFVIPTRVLANSGSVGFALIIWVCCGFMSLFTSLAYVELNSYFAVTGGEYMYLLEAFAPNRHREKTWKSVIGFVNVVITIFFQRPASFAVQGLAISEYLTQLFPDMCKNNGGTKFMAASILLLVTFLNCFSNKVSTKFINSFTACKIGTLLLIITLGMAKLFQGTSEAISTGMEGTKLTPDSIALAFYSCMWAYGGVTNLNTVAREIRNPKKNVLRAFIASFAIIITLYLLVNVSYFVILTKEDFATSGAIAVDLTEKVLGRAGGYLMIISVAMSSFGSCLGGSFATIRMSYAAARENHVVDILSYLNIYTSTPMIGFLLNVILALIMLSYSSLLGLISAVTFVEFIFTIMTMVALLIFRRRKDLVNSEGVIKMPTIIPYINIAVSIFFFVIPLIRNPKPESMIGLVFVAISAVIYFAVIYREKSIPGLDSVRRGIQRLFLVVPPNDKEF